MSNLSFMKRLTLLIVFLALLIIDSQLVYSQNAQYDLSVKIVPVARRLEVGGTIRLPAVSEERDKIELYLSPKMEKLEMQLVEPKSPAPLALLSNQEEAGDTKWIFKSGNPIPAGQTILLQFSYVSENKTAPQFNISPEISFAGGGGELWYPQTDFKNRETGMLRFKAPAGETVISNGELEGSESQQAKGEFVFRVSEPSKFAFVSAKYTVVRRKGKVPFNLYLLQSRPHAKTILDGTARALDFLTSLFGEFPYKEFSFVEIKFPTIVRGTGEYGFVFANSPEMDNFDLSYWAHEIGHQWWGNLVRSQAKTTGQMMLSEGVTQFGSLLAVEAVQGEEAAARFRRSGYRTGGQSADRYFQLVRSGTDFPLTAHIPQNQNETLTMHRLANTKGFILLDMLSRLIGRERFAEILRKFIRGKNNQLTSWQELQKFVETNAKQDVRWFFEQWFERTGAPDYQLEWKQEGKKLYGEIKQTEPYFRAALEVEIKGASRRLIKTIEVRNGKTEFNWAVPFKIESVILDPDYKVLRWLPEFRR
jgi:hypothetical protein